MAETHKEYNTLTHLWTQIGFYVNAYHRKLAYKFKFPSYRYNTAHVKHQQLKYVWITLVYNNLIEQHWMDMAVKLKI